MPRERSNMSKPVTLHKITEGLWAAFRNGARVGTIAITDNKMGYVVANRFGDREDVRTLADARFWLNF
jgi:hypothetical protein